MAEVSFTPEELASLFEDTAKLADTDGLDVLLGRHPNHSAPAPAHPEEGNQQPANLIGDERSAPTTDRAQSSENVITSAVLGQAPVGMSPPNAFSSPAEFAWENAYHLLPPGLLPLLKRYPAIGLTQHRKYGLVLLGAYLEDKQQRVRRNLKIGNETFFFAPELEVIEPDTRALGCRVVIKTFRHEPAMRIRYWENTPSGDVPGKSGTFELTERGLRRVGAPKAAH